MFSATTREAASRATTFTCCPAFSLSTFSPFREHESITTMLMTYGQNFTLAYASVERSWRFCDRRFPGPVDGSVSGVLRFGDPAVFVRPLHHLGESLRGVLHPGVTLARR